jgi:hypothetical protein
LAGAVALEPWEDVKRRIERDILGGEALSDQPSGLRSVISTISRSPEMPFPLRRAQTMTKNKLRPPALLGAEGSARGHLLK